MAFARSDIFELDARYQRCEPSGECVVRSQCARGIAKLPQSASASPKDFSTETGGGTVLCAGYMAAARLRVAQAKRNSR